MRLSNFLLLAVLSSCICVTFAQQKSPYKILGVPESASDEQIKQRFRELTKKYHPDKNSDPKAKEYYLEVTNAYQTLSDPVQRRKYEQQQDNVKFNSGMNQGWNFYGNGYSIQTKQANHKKKWQEAYSKKNGQSYQNHFNTKKKTYVPTGGSSILGWIKSKIFSLLSGGITEILIYGVVIYVVIKIFGSLVHVQMGQM